MISGNDYVDLYKSEIRRMIGLIIFMLSLCVFEIISFIMLYEYMSILSGIMFVIPAVVIFVWSFNVINISINKIKRCRNNIADFIFVGRQKKSYFYGGNDNNERD